MKRPSRGVLCRLQDLFRIKKYMKKTAVLLFFAVAMAFQPCCGQQVRRLGVSEMFDLLEHGNSTLRASRTGVDAAREGVRAARSQRLPDVSVQLSGSYAGNVQLTDRDFSNAHGLSSPHWGNQFLVDARQTVYGGGAINAGIKMAELGERQASLSVDATRERERFLVLSQYLDLQKLANRERVLLSNIDLTEKLISNINDKYNQGVALKNDVTRYELQLETLKLRLTELHNARSVASHQLCLSLGLDGDVSIDPADDVASVAYGRDGEKAWQQQASAGSPSLKLAAVGTEMAAANEKLARSEMLPKVQVMLQNNFNGPITFELPPIDKNLNVWFVGVGVQYQLSSLFKSNRKVSQARLATRQARERQTAAAEQLDNQMHAAYTEYDQSYAELNTCIKKVELARQNYDVINDRYLNQLALVTDMLDASNTRLDAELGEADARIGIAYAYYKLKYVAGTL